MFIPLLHARGVSCFGRGGSLAFAAFAILFTSVASAKQFSVPPMPISPYADTEVATNIAFNTHRSDVKELELKFTLECTSSNCIQVAFGTDADGDGKLSFTETETVYGWRNGRYFAEDVASGFRYEHPVETQGVSGTKVFTINMETTREYLPKTFSAQVDGSAVLTNLTSNVPAWLYRSNWNLMCITRRGVGTPSEWFSCDIGYSFFTITIR